jgi:hypothetical protein
MKAIWWYKGTFYGRKKDAEEKAKPENQPIYSLEDETAPERIEFPLYINDPLKLAEFLNKLDTRYFT